MTEAKRQLARERGKEHWDLVVRVGSCAGIKPHFIQRFWSQIQHLNQRVLNGDADAVTELRAKIRDCLSPPTPAPDTDYYREPPRGIPRAAIDIMRWAIRKIDNPKEARRAFEFVIREAERGGNR